MGKSNNLVGKKFERLLVVEKLEEKYQNGCFLWRCVCDCGNQNVIVPTTSLTMGKTRSCGCLQRERAGGVQYADITGERFGRLLVIKIDHIKNNRYFWLCQCDCGNTIVTRTTCLRRGTTQSCGCLHKEIVSLEYGEASFNQLWKRYKKAAKNRNIIFDLDRDLFKDIINKNCFYCGKEPSQITKNVHDNGDCIYNGIDRLDNDLGYISSNVVPCCGMCNMGKKDFSKEIFLNWIKDVYNHSFLESVSI